MTTTGTDPDHDPGTDPDHDPVDPADIEAVCFDLDDTLFEYESYVRAGLRTAADRIEERTGERLHEEVLALYFEEGVRDGTFDRLLDRHGLSVPVADLVDAYHDSAAPLEPYPDAVDTLDRLAGEYDLGLVTDGRNGRGKLRRLGLVGTFETVVVAHESGHRKREDAEPFRRALDALGAPPETVVYVGDNPRTDLPVPDRMGMYTVRLRRGRYEARDPGPAPAPDVEIESLDALLGVLGVEPRSSDGG